MYLRTPKRYQPGRKRRHLFSLRWLWLWILTPLVVFFGIQIYERRDEFGPPIQEMVASAFESARVGVSTITAPTPLPTADPGQALALADAAWRRGAVEEAIQLYRETLPAAPNDLVAHYRYTLGLIMEGRRPEALVAAENTITANPFSADAWAIHALALDRNDRPREAIASALQALSINPRSARALAFMAEAYLDANQIELAQQTLRRALETDPDNVEARYVNGLFLRDAQYNYPAARDEFRAAYEDAPNLPYIAVELAWSEWYLQNYQVAIEVLQDVLERNPNNLDALYAIAYVYYQALGSPAQSEEFLQRCLRASPENLACLRYLGQVQIFGLGNTQGALQTYQRLIDAGTQRPIDFFYAARSYINVGDCASGITLLRQGYELELAAASPDVDLLSRFEQNLSDCGAPVSAPFNPLPAAEDSGEVGDA
jgi:tetratricopeptide (TPR) repeat protein